MRQPDYSSPEAFAQWQQDTWGFFVFTSPAELPIGFVSDEITFVRNDEVKQIKSRARIVAPFSYAEFFKLLEAFGLEQTLLAYGPELRGYHFYKALAE